MTRPTDGTEVGVGPGVRSDGAGVAQGEGVAPAPANEYRARCLLALAVLRHRTRTFDPANSDVIALERVLQGLDLDSIAYGEVIL